MQHNTYAVLSKFRIRFTPHK